MAAYPVRSFVVLPLLTLSLWISAGCGSSPSSPDTPPSASTPQTTAVIYSGTFQSSNDSYGSITLTAQVPAAVLASVDGMLAPRAVANATGTLKPGIGVSIPLTGTFDTATGKFVVTGGGFTITATVTSTPDGGVLNGTVTTPTTQGTVVALPPTPTSTVITYCGNYIGGNTGTLVVTRRDNKLVALVAEKGEPAPYSINGTLTGTAIDLSFTWAPPDVGSTTVTGTLEGTVMSGTWRSNTVEGGKPVSYGGTWVVRAGSCPL